MSPKDREPGPAGNEGSDPRDGSAVNIDQVADYLSGALQGDERAQFEARVLEDSELAQALYAEMNLEAEFHDIADLRRAAAQPRSRFERATAGSASTDLVGPAPTPRRAVTEDDDDPWWVRWKLQLLAPALAVATLAIILINGPFRDGFDPNEPVMRSGASAMHGLSPVGDLDQPPRDFQWTSHPDAYVYRIDVYDLESRLLFGSTTRDTTATAPTAAISWPAEGYWQVTSLSAAGTKLSASEPVRFRIVP